MWKETITKEFVGAQPGSQFTEKCIALLESQGFTPESTVYGNSTCPDEINRSVVSIKDYYGRETFHLGGLAGYPFVGISGFNAFAHHAPNECEVQQLVILYGPHVGVSSQGMLGEVRRRCMKTPTSACGSAVGAYNEIKKLWEKGMVHMPRFERLDQQQYWIKSLLTSHLKTIIESDNPMKEIVDIMWMAIDEKMNDIIASQRAHFDGKVCLIGGVQINTPNGYDSYFQPRRVDIVDMTTKETKSFKEMVK